MTYSAIMEAILTLCVQVSLLILTASWLSRCAQNDRAEHRAWRVCHVAILSLTIATFLLPHLRIATLSVLLPDQDRSAVLEWTNRLGRFFVWFWAAGFFIGAGSLVFSCVRVRGILTSATPMPAEELARRHPQLELKVSGGREIRWYLTGAADGPFCWQIHQPLIVLPAYVLDFDDDELAAVLNHETCHLTEGHPLSLFLQRLVELIYWFHPIVWWGSWQAARCREILCDQAAASSAEEASACLRSLLKLAERGIRVTGGMPAGLNFGDGASLTRFRAASLAEFDRPQSTSILTRFLPPMLLAAAVAVSCLQLPINMEASSRSAWSPWPTWTSNALQVIGISARDYEIDNHRFEEHH